MTSLLETASVPTDGELAATAATIVAVQGPTGFIAFTKDGCGDPWNHIEAAMALTVMGEERGARRAYEWLLSAQRIDGAWHGAYRSDGSIADARLNSNVSCYIATGLWHHLLTTGDRDFAERSFPAVEAAMTFVLGLQQVGGEILWSIETNGQHGAFALRAACSSIYASLQCALGLAAALGHDRPHWRVCAAQLARALRERPEAFANKDEYAMDWYYPVLGGVIVGDDARRHLDDRWDEFHIPGCGIRCQSIKQWVTTAETAECALVLARTGAFGLAGQLLAGTGAQRCNDGSYLTGRVQPNGQEFPSGERTTYSAAAVILAADVLRGGVATRSIFGIEPHGERMSTRRLPAPADSSSTKSPDSSASQ